MTTCSSVTVSSAMVPGLPVNVIPLEAVAELFDGSEYSEHLASTPDFDLHLLEINQGDRLYLLQGALTGMSLVFRSVEMVDLNALLGMRLTE